MALREINLVDPGLAHRRFLKRHLLFWIGLLLTVQVSIWGAVYYQIQVVLPQKRALTRLDSMHMDLGVRIEAIKAAQSELQALQEQQAAINAINNHPSGTLMLARLTDIMSPDTWLSRFDLLTPESRNQQRRVKIAGTTQSNRELGDFLDRLAMEAMFSGVALVVAKESQVIIGSDPAATARAMISFEIEFTLTKG